MRITRHRSGRPYRTARRIMFEIYGTTCHICRHEGAGEADHLDSLAIDPDQPIDPHRMRPAHGTSAPCPVCPLVDGKPRRCNQERGARPLGGRELRTSQEW